MDKFILFVDLLKFIVETLENVSEDFPCYPCFEITEFYNNRHIWKCNTRIIISDNAASTPLCGVAIYFTNILRSMYANEW